MKSTPAGCFGKLPVYADFIRHNAEAPEIAALDRWLEEGMYRSRRQLGKEWGGALEAGTPTRFLYHHHDSRRTLVGVGVRGQDKAGRRFPFLVFRSVEGATSGALFSLLPIALADFLNAAEQTIEMGQRGLDVKALRAQVSCLRGVNGEEAAAAELDAYLTTQTTGALWEGLFGRADDPRRFTLVGNLAHAVRGGVVPRYVLRFPCTGARNEISFFLELARRLGSALPTLFLWNVATAEHPAKCRILIDDLSARYFPPLFFEDTDDEFGFDLVAEGEASDASAWPALPPGLGDPQLSLGAMLAILDVASP